MNMRIASITLTAGLLCACSQVAVYERPQLPMAAEFESGSDLPDTVAPQWWRRFGSPQLDALIEQATASNFDLSAAVARIDQARASLRIASADLLPNASASGSLSSNRQKQNGSWDSGESDQVALGVGYELDLWGGNRAARAAALARLDASRWDRAAVVLVLQSDVATRYFQILALSEQLEIAAQNLDAAQKLLDLVQVRYDAGAATALELAQQRSTLLSIAATIPSLQQNLGAARHAMKVLLGGEPGSELAAAPIATLTVPQASAGVPAALLEQRPEIRIAEARLIAANADIGAARAALLPSVELSLSAGVSGALTGGSSQFVSLAGSLAQTLFKAGALRAQVQLSEAAQQELTASYLQTVLQSVQEVEDSLVAQRSARDRATILEQAAEQAREVYRLALIRFEAGSEDLLALLDAQRTRLSAEDSLVQARYNRLLAAAQLFKAVGGGWSEAALDET